MEKFQALYDKVIEILYWAKYQGHISEDAKEILEDNITQIKQDIEKQ